MEVERAMGMDDRTSPARVLVVDDEERNRRLLVAMLEAEGHAPLEAASGAQALERVRESPPDLVLLDVMMPGMDGYEVARALKADAATRPIPVVMVTSLDDRESRLRGLEAGAEEFVTKPLDRIELRVRVRNLLRLKAYGDSLARREVEMRGMVDRLESANRDLESFSYSVSHDLRAPLGAIEGFTRVIQEDYAAQLPPEARRLLDRVQANARQMQRLIDDLLEFARTGRRAVVRIPVDLREIAGRCLEGLRDEIAARKVEVRMGELPRCDVDPVLMTQVFENLLSNALKYTRNRERALVEIGCEDNDGEAAIYVRDNGTGFDMQHAGKLFGVFQRLHSASEFEGTGVGLAIVQRIIQHHGGRVWAEGKVGEGAAFHFSIPRLSCPPKSTVPRTE